LTQAQELWSPFARTQRRAVGIFVSSIRSYSTGSCR